MLYALPYCTSFFIHSRLPTIPAPSGRLDIGSGGSTRACCCGRSHRATVELFRATLAVVRSSTVAVTNLDFAVAVAVAVAGRIILILQLLPTLGLGGVAGSCLVIVTSGCLASVLNQSFSGVRFSSEVQSISPLSSCSTYSSTGTDRCARTKLIAVLCRLVLPTAW
jgi:hypothetical protein